MFRHLTVRFFILPLIILLVHACNLTYVPVKTPEMIINERHKTIETELKSEFLKKSMGYQSIRFGESVTIKPSSYFVLDSLYTLKYELEKKNLIDSKLEKQIQTQQFIVQQDTTPIYHLENHVFSVTEENQKEQFYAEIYTDKTNAIKKMTLLESAAIPDKLEGYYAIYLLKESFIAMGYKADEAEIAFYDFYGHRLEQLQGTERAEFLIFMLALMKLANRGSSLDKVYLIQEMTRTYVQGNAKNFMDEKFNKLEEIVNEQNEVESYQIQYSYGKRSDANVYESTDFMVVLDPYLQLIEVKKI